jgi:hypothetical protein
MPGAEIVTCALSMRAPPGELVGNEEEGDRLAVVCTTAPWVVVCEVLLKGGGGVETSFGDEDCGRESDREEE